MTLTIKKRIIENNHELPELKNFFGKNVLITISDEFNDNSTSRDVENFLSLAGNISIDEAAVNELRELSLI